MPYPGAEKLTKCPTNTHSGGGPGGMKGLEIGTPGLTVCVKKTRLLLISMSGASKYYNS